jgi:hypothetical protein
MKVRVAGFLQGLPVRRQNMVRRTQALQKQLKQLVVRYSFARPRCWFALRIATKTGAGDWIAYATAKSIPAAVRQVKGKLLYTFSTPFDVYITTFALVRLSHAFWFVNILLWNRYLCWNPKAYPVELGYADWSASGLRLSAVSRFQEIKNQDNHCKTGSCGRIGGF